MKTLAYLAALLLFAGCTKLDDAPNASEDTARRGPVTPPGIAPLDALNSGSAAGTGSTPASNPAGGPPAGGSPQGGARQGIIGKTTNQIVDLHAARAQNPNLTIADQRAQGGDPISFAMDAYVDVRSRASTFGMTRAVQLYQAEHGRWPSYDEFMQMMRENRVEFTMVEPYRMYAYDSKTGAIVVLEDPDEKRRRYQAAGIPVDE